MAVLGLAERKQVRLFLRPDAYGRYVSCLVYLPQGPVHHAGQAARPGDPAQRLRRRLGRLQRDGGQLGPGPAARRGARRARAARSPRSTRRPSRRGSPPRSAPGTMTWPRRRSASSAPSAPPWCCAAAPTASRRRTRPTSRRPTRWRTWRWCSGCGRSPRRSRSAFRSTRTSPGGCGSSGFPRSRSPTCCRSCSTWGSRCSTSTRTSSADRPTRSGSTTSAFAGAERAATPAEADTMRAGFEAALTALWQGQTEDDDFNGLVLDAELTWRQVVVLRAYARYLRQAGIQFSQNYLQRVLRANPSDHPAAGPAVRVPVRPGARRTARRSAARRSPRNCAARSTRWSASTTTASSAPTWP